jgi:hypothetical protein
LRREPNNALYYMGHAKWTSMLTNRLLLETGYSTNVEYVTIQNQAVSTFDRFSPGWYAGARQEDLVLRTIDNSGGLEYGIDPHRFVTVIENFGPSLHQPTAILQPRLLRLAMQMRF